MVPFHRLLISAAIVFCACFAAWAAWSYRESQRVGMLVLALVFAVFAAALSYYLRHLKRFLGR
jgi:small-conductance mechanosensitive channel